MKQKSKIKTESDQTNTIPKFIVIAVIIMILIIGFIGYNFLYFSPEEIVPYSGYALSGKNITENLQDKNYVESEKSKTVKINTQEMIFKKLNQYYVGKNEEINLEYPIYINGDTALYNLSQANTLIRQDFKEISSYPRYILADGKIYNQSDLQRADYYKYIFLRNENNIFINQFYINVKTQYNEYEIPKNSIICFQTGSIAYYTIEKEELKYNRIEDIDLNTQIKMDKREYRYEKLLINLKLKEVRKQIEEEPAEEIKLEEIKEIIKEKIEIQEEKEETKEEIQEESKKQEEPGEYKYIKPEVTVSNFEANVYTAKTTVIIKDPTGEITSPITFEFKKNGKTYLRKSVLSSGILEIYGLEPNEKYQITGSYIFKNEEGKKIQKEILSQEIQTKGIETLEPITLGYQNGELFSNKIQIKGLKIESNLNSETLKGIKSFEINVDGTSYKIPNSRINQMLRGQEIEQETAENLSSNSNIDYEFKAYDLKGNELKIINNKGNTRTSKAKPTANIKVKSKDISEVELTLELKNKDNCKIENLHYEIYDIKGNIVQEKELEKNQTKVILKDLDPNQYYEVKIYVDYDLEDNRGIQKNQEIGKCNFTSVPLSTLGYLNLNINLKDITKDNAKLEVSINDERTDERLIYVLDKISIYIYEQLNKNNINEKTEEFTSKKIIEAEELEKLKISEKKEIIFEDLKSNTTYRIETKAILKQGNTEEEISGTHTTKQFITKKEQAEVLIKNQFVTGSMIDFDVKINDKDNAILENEVRMELRDSKGKLVQMEVIKTNQDYLRLTYEKLQEKENYIINFYANEYNEGSDDSTYKSNFLLKLLEIYTEPGISGNIDLTNLVRTSTGTNLVDVRSEVKWYSSCFNTGSYYDKTYNPKTQELRLYAGKNGAGQYYVYDLREYAGQTITFSFLAKLDEHSKNMAIYLQNSKTGNRTRINGITENEWTRYTYTVTLHSTGYLGFYLVSANTTYDQALLLKEVQMELGNRRTNYKPYEYNLEGQLQVNLTDKRDEIETKDYYINIKEKGKETISNRYIEIDEYGKVENSIKQYNFNENTNYEIDLVVKLSDRSYVISTIEFSTTGEILGIRNKDDFLQIQPYGNYIVLDDIDLRGSSSYFGGSYFGFRGTLDFQGHTVLIDTTKRSGIFYIIERTGVVKNIVVDEYINNTMEYDYYRPIFTYNRGTISNLMVNLKECTKLPNIGFQVMGYQNTGLIENFVINLEVPLYGARVLTAGVNYNSSTGIIRNGYIYGEDIQAIFEIGQGQSRDSAGLVISNDKGTIENVYSLIHVINVKQTGVTDRSANLVYNNSVGIVKNVYSVGYGTLNDKNYGPTVGTNSSGRVYNAYYFADETFKNSYNLKTTNLALYDAKFQNLILNSNGQFLVDSLITQNYYPQIKMSSKMPNQEYIQLPEVLDKDLVDILSSEVIEENNKSAKLELSVNNPSGEQITNIKIKDITTRILTQKYEDGKSIVEIEIKDPVRYVSKYSVMSITSRGAMQMPYTRNYEENERIIAVDMYKEISNIEEWKQINKSPTENYRLMKDIDFLNCGKEIIVTNQYTGKFDGNNYTIKNIRIPQDSNNYGLFYNLNGEIRNLNVENFNKELPKDGSYIAFISLSYEKALLDNVHLKNARLSVNIPDGTTYVGGLIASSSASIINNCSTTNVDINIDGGLNNARAGGLIANASNTRISNSFVQDLNIYAKRSLINYGIGGLVGRDASGVIDSCYTTGKIITDAENTGGIYGFLNGTVKHCYSLVDIQSQTDYLGGIGGFDNNSSTSSTYQNLSLGNIYTTKKSQNVRRILGNNETEIKNYGYIRQKINGYNNNEDLGAQKLFTQEELFKKSTYEEILEFGENYNYDELEKGILPKLYSTDGITILPNQKDNTLVEKEIFIEEVEAEKLDVNTAAVRIKVSNPSAVNINKVEVEYANVNMISSINQEGKTYIDIILTPERAYDSYTITKLKYSDNGENKELSTQAKIDIQFYKEINTFEDWQKIDRETAQNYRLNTDIDFTGRINPNTNVSIGRLESEGAGHTLKNLEITVTGTGKGLIKELKNSLRNITFENITVNNTATSGNYTGLIVRNMADIKNVTFKDITVNASKIGYVGSIAYSSCLSIQGVNLENITASGTQHVGGFIGLADSRSIY